MGLEAELIALAFLFANVDQADAGLLHLQHIAAVDVAEQGPLVQIGGFAIHVGAHIQHEHLLLGIPGGEEGPNGRAVNALEPS